MHNPVVVPIAVLGLFGWLPCAAAVPSTNPEPSGSPASTRPQSTPPETTPSNARSSSAPRGAAVESDNTPQAREPAPVPGSGGTTNVAATAQPPSHPEPAVAAPVAPPVAPSELQDVCSLDPSACPSVSSEITLQGPITAAPAISQRHGDIGSKTDERFVMPSGYSEVRGELAFITGDGVVTPSRLKLGDLTLFRPSARRAFGEKVELSLGTTLLAKEPTANHDWLWQGATLGATLEPWPGYAMLLEAKGGPMLDGAGSVWSGAAGIAGKWSLDRTARVLLSVGDLFTAMDNTGQMGARTWLNEIVFGGEAQFGRSEAAAWVGVNYAVPVAKAGDAPNSPVSVALDPTVRIDLQVGGVLRVGQHDDWDLFAFYAWIDRGDRERPETLLPVLDGGFDQQQLVMGVSHRFESHKYRSDSSDSSD